VSAHWLRHIAGAATANSQVDLRNVKHNLGHASISTTSIYLHSTDDACYQETVDKHRMEWIKD
jgi:site-specific recombinase XerD